MRCPLCKFEIPDEAKVCGYCGSQIYSPEVGKMVSGAWRITELLWIFVGAAFIFFISAAIISRLIY